jgi:23S rRNA (guanosine2251-2'-O)-methyltransferase
MISKSTFIYGFNPVVEAINAGKEIEKIFILKSMQQIRTSELINLANRYKIPFQFVPKEKLNRLTRQNHQGVIAMVSAVSFVDIETLLPTIYESAKTPFFIILDKITDVRNFGSIARSAECAGVDAIIIPSRGSAMINADAVKTSSGALNNIPLCRTENLKETILFLKNCGITMIGATEKSELNYFTADFSQPVAIIMGSEELGISEEYLKLCDKTVKIPMLGKTQSLNVSVAAGIIMFEVLKQRL